MGQELKGFDAGVPSYHANKIFLRGGGEGIEKDKSLKK
jgi:hypothetical protein